ncbi:MAG: hypothetical protein ACJ74G_01595 [Blastocatellia bacterium]
MSKMIADTTEQPSAAPRPLWPDVGIRAAAVIEIGLDELGERDLLLIQTANSVYSFTVAEPKEGCGMLMGGRLGEAGAPARLTGAIPRANDDERAQGELLAPGLHAVFLVATAGDSRWLVTSAIKRLTHLKVPAGRPAGSLEDVRQFSVERDKLRP